MAFDTTVRGQLRIDCLLCPVQRCLGRTGSGEEVQAWQYGLLPQRALMPGGAALFSTGDKQCNVYSVRGGCLKTYTVDAGGNERIRGFYFPGDLVGLDALGGGRHLSTAVAVVPSQVCTAPLEQLKRLMGRQPQLAQYVVEQTSLELALALALSGDFSAEQRLAAFLLHMHDRLGGEVLHLPMSQRDIGDYLRLATETVCRTLKGFERRGWLAVNARQIRFRDGGALRRLAQAVVLPNAEREWALAA